jgi:flagellar basal-body rod protein FlgF
MQFGIVLALMPTGKESQQRFDVGASVSLIGIQNVARTLVNYQRLQNVLAHNLANVSTEGYKANFFSLELQGNGTTPVPVTALDLRQGAIRDTGRMLDVALEGDGFLVVQTAAGERLTRGGSLRLDAAGMLVDTQGDQVLGEDGPIVITGAETVIGTDGVVRVDGVQVGILRLETVADKANLTKEAAGRFAANGVTVAATNAKLYQAAIEESNFDPVLGTVDMITMAREFEANMSSLRAMDDVLDNVVNDIGRPAV